ncbi:MAG: hypothetical protein QOE96_2848 [Blastocatellia bacterium]|jgi:hypothetical protein|nr:hypothetical protein [Blastocatellia bacterium]
MRLKSVLKLSSFDRAEARLKRIKGELLPLPYLIVDTKIVAGILGVTRRDVIELVRLGVLRPCGGKAEGIGNQELYFSRHTVEKRETFVSTCTEEFRNLVTCYEASKIAGSRS